MPKTTRFRLVPTLVASILLLLAADLLAGTKVKVKGDVEEVAEQVEKTFEELEITTADSSVNSDWARAVGKAKSGSRVTVAVSHAGDDECEVSISSDSPADPDIEERFLRLMQSR